MTVELFRALRHRITEGELPDVSAGTAHAAGLSRFDLIELFESQVQSRLIDLRARVLQARGDAYYTIGSAGHEGNAAIAKALRLTDPAFLHYRDAAFFIQRSKALPGQTVSWDMLLSFMASSDDPIAGGRHKVLGSKALSIPPQTSTIASHLPKAVGAAYGLGLWKRLGGAGEWPTDSVVLCSFGDASLNHSTAQGAINTACWTAYQGLPMPLIFVCEDNGLGISTPTPQGWVAASMANRPGLHYIACNGLDLLDTWQAASRAAIFARTHRQPVFLHMRCVRLYGHAGSDAQQAYLSQAQIQAMTNEDPLAHGAARLLRETHLSRADLGQLLDTAWNRLSAVGDQASQRPRLRGSEAVMSAIVPPIRPSLANPAAELPAIDPTPQPMARLINQSLHRLMARFPQLVMAGEDIGNKGGVYGVTQRLQQQYGRHRVIDTLLDEQSILGLGIGMGQNGLIPILEIQFLAYLHNAEDQLRGEAATLSFFSNGQFTNPMVVRIAGLGYQKGFGGHFHNDNSLAVLRDIPGLLVACPSDGTSAVGLLQEAVRLADEEQRVVVIIEPIARYHNRDLLTEGDQLACQPDPGPDYRLPRGRFRQCRPGSHLAIITYGNGVTLSLQAAEQLAPEGISVRVIDLCWLTEIDHAALYEAVKDCKQILVVDECRRHGSISEELISELSAQGVASSRMDRVTALDSFIALGEASTSTLPAVGDILEHVRALTGADSTAIEKGA
ncbi:thiamine pyrophosphate-dependent enzyme [Marinobacter sp. M3C]|jgi:2-oxoisovalerate dehydrogenase E1 component|uniref:thiamine pyrophosphate-dependent enzyme n=1 Tax=unclassified Marinobacter TaxID=83889 RepID=UPI00201016E6|nr:MULTISPECIES: thiamine pyrophosphate-dependent enzyme [unclassified Marinobacter]MCL1478951.1 thiamine pyrophosphate-dependent enzyme [Marinobacter sp.]MCL1480642.1 thiamine pyrophosphate-dependent enzyme [Marinobacter sp.]MCL1484204.1 thiamine pyrophosphate-dependent enzyme [Marinobacter sp.]MCL1487545.1 thiamine pyrophosphate-dependent enzyme [Marinobacter sp.]UQG57768.1 thiamine pyrophosphate-dependent enzyme [Marinobacter sp. M4C]